ncbi:uncharacterized protein LOC144130480 [Amblyomma americanum]
MGSVTFALVSVLLLFGQGTCDLCDICRRKRDSAVRIPYNQRWHFDASSFLCQPFNFCDDEITERMKGWKSKAEINCGGVDCFEWLQELLKKRQAQQSDLPKTMLGHHSHHTHHEATTAAAPPVRRAATAVVAAQKQQPSSEAAAAVTTSQRPATARAASPVEPLGANEATFEFGVTQPHAVHIALAPWPKHSPHRKPDLCTLKPNRGSRWPCSQRWYYNVVEDACKTFTFCGHKGNRNNFPSHETCHKECHGASLEKRS